LKSEKKEQQEQYDDDDYEEPIPIKWKYPADTPTTAPWMDWQSEHDSPSSPTNIRWRFPAETPTTAPWTEYVQESLHEQEELKKPLMFKMGDVPTTAPWFANQKPGMPASPTNVRWVNKPSKHRPVELGIIPQDDDTTGKMSDITPEKEEPESESEDETVKSPVNLSDEKKDKPKKPKQKKPQQQKPPVEDEEEEEEPEEDDYTSEVEEEPESEDETEKSPVKPSGKPKRKKPIVSDTEEEEEPEEKPKKKKPIVSVTEEEEPEEKPKRKKPVISVTEEEEKPKEKPKRNKPIVIDEEEEVTSYVRPTDPPTKQEEEPEVDDDTEDDDEEESEKPPPPPKKSNLVPLLPGVPGIAAPKVILQKTATIQAADGTEIPVQYLKAPARVVRQKSPYLPPPPPRNPPPPIYQSPPGTVTGSGINLGSLASPPPPQQLPQPQLPIIPQQPPPSTGSGEQEGGGGEDQSQSEPQSETEPEPEEEESNDDDTSEEEEDDDDDKVRETVAPTLSPTLSPTLAPTKNATATPSVSPTTFPPTQFLFIEVEKRNIDGNVQGGKVIDVANPVAQPEKAIETPGQVETPLSLNFGTQGDGIPQTLTSIPQNSGPTGESTTISGAVPPPPKKNVELSFNIPGTTSENDMPSEIVSWVDHQNDVPDQDIASNPALSALSGLTIGNVGSDSEETEDAEEDEEDDVAPEARSFQADMMMDDSVSVEEASKEPEECPPANTAALEDYHGPSGEDEAIYEIYYSNPRKTCGTVVEIGAGNGLFHSKSLFFEQALHWKSVLIESNPDSFVDLKNNRKLSSSYHGGFCEGDAMEHYDNYYRGTKGHGEVMSGKHGEEAFALDDFDESMLTEVPCLSLSPILAENDVKKIDIMFVAVDGDPLSVIRKMDWTVRVDVWVIEMNGYDDRDDLVRDVLLKNDYVKAEWDISRWCNPYMMGTCMPNEVFLAKGYNPLPQDVGRRLSEVSNRRRLRAESSSERSFLRRPRT